MPKYGPANSELLAQTFEGLKRLAQLQNSNRWITLSATVTGGIWVYVRGQQFCLINPAKTFLRVGAAYNHKIAANEMRSAFDEVVGAGEAEEMDSVYLTQWRFPPAALPHLWAFFERMPRPSLDEVQAELVSHPRTFPGEARQAALEDFFSGGRRCPGVQPGHAPHHLTNEPVEYDHVLPWSKGGASTFENLQILCVACNRLKRDTAR